MKLTAKQKDEETTTVYSKDIISVVKLPEEFTAALLFCNNFLYTTEATGGLSNIVRPMAGKPIRHLLWTRHRRLSAGLRFLYGRCGQSSEGQAFRRALADV